MIVKAIKFMSLIIPIIRYSCPTAEVKNVMNKASGLLIYLLLKG